MQLYTSPWKFIRDGLFVNYLYLDIVVHITVHITSISQLFPTCGLGFTSYVQVGEITNYHVRFCFLGSADFLWANFVHVYYILSVCCPEWKNESAEHFIVSVTACCLFSCHSGCCGKLEKICRNIVWLPWGDSIGHLKYIKLWQNYVLWIPIRKMAIKDKKC